MRVGLIAFSCGKCKDAPYIREEIGCEKPMEKPGTWLGEDEQFYNCPIKFINQAALDFAQKYDAYKSNIATPPDYEKQSAKFNDGVQILEGHFGMFTKMKKGEA